MKIAYEKEEKCENEENLFTTKVKASLVSPQLALLAQKPVLVPSLPVARPETHLIPVVEEVFKKNSERGVGVAKNSSVFPNGRGPFKEGFLQKIDTIPKQI